MLIFHCNISQFVCNMDSYELVKNNILQTVNFMKNDKLFENNILQIVY